MHDDWLASSYAPPRVFGATITNTLSRAKTMPTLPRSRWLHGGRRGRQRKSNGPYRKELGNKTTSQQDQGTERGTTRGAWAKSQAPRPAAGARWGGGVERVPLKG